MVEREKLSKLSDLALRNRRVGLTKVLPPLGVVLRGSLMERYLTCGNPEHICTRDCRRSGSAPSRNHEVLLRAEAGLWLGPRDDCARRGRRVWRVSLFQPFGCKNYTAKHQKSKCEFCNCEFPTYLIELPGDRFGVRSSCRSA